MKNSKKKVVNLSISRQMQKSLRGLSLYSQIAFSVSYKQRGRFGKSWSSVLHF